LKWFIRENAVSIFSERSGGLQRFLMLEQSLEVAIKLFEEIVNVEDIVSVDGGSIGETGAFVRRQVGGGRFMTQSLDHRRHKVEGAAEGALHVDKPGVVLSGQNVDVSLPIATSA